MSAVQPAPSPRRRVAGLSFATAPPIRLIAVAACAWLIVAPAAALDDADRSAARSVIEHQLEAFRRGDAEAAYGFATPTIRQMFPDKDVFMEMVRRGYAPVYRPRSYEFGATRDENGLVELALRIQDENGVDWDAVYTVQRQPDGSWRIAGCRLVKRPGEAV